MAELLVVEVILSLLREGSGKGAVVMGTLLGLFAVLWGVLLARFVFSRSSRRRKETTDV
jgi:hypothetical protein